MVLGRLNVIYHTVGPMEAGSFPAARAEDETCYLRFFFLKSFHVSPL